MRRIAIPLALLLLVAWAATQAGPDEPSTDFSDAERWREVFESPERGRWQKPATVTRILAVEQGQKIADLGAGTGYFIPRLSSMVGETGKVYAVDVEPAMVEHVEARRIGANVEAILADPDDPKLPDAELDLVLVVNTWHHIADRSAYLPRLERSLASGGRVAVIDWREGDLPEGPPAGHKLPRDDVVRDFEKSGWDLVGESTALPYQYFLIFSPATGD